MMEIPRYMEYLKSNESIITKEGKSVQVFHLKIKDDLEIFEEWAKQFRRNYCSDSELKEMTRIMNITPSEYLKKNKLPSGIGLGLSTMSGDFGEILVADYLQFVEKYTVPRTRYKIRENKDNSTLGSDVLGYKIYSLEPKEDEVIVMEVKSSASNSPRSKDKEKLQEAIDHSNKDFKCFSTSIVASYLKLRTTNPEQANIVERFLNIVDKPFNVIYGAVAVHSNRSYDRAVIKEVVAKNHRSFHDLKLFVIYSDNLMDFIKNIYEKASVV